jgi:release factor glutamine methyltransferase
MAIETARSDKTIAAHLKEGTQALRQHDVDNPRLDAQILMVHAIGGNRLVLLTDPDRLLRDEEAEAYHQMIARRCRREPVSHIVGYREFWSLTLRVNGDVLDPRPDSETLISAVLDSIPDKSAPLSLLDLGTGSGCLLLALLSELPEARGTGIDISRAALGIAEGNAEALGLAARVRFLHGDWALGLTGPFNVIVTNPPYIPAQDIVSLAPEVAQHEPIVALAGGGDGLESYRRLIPQIPRLLSDDGLFAVEFGQGQAEAVSEIIRVNGLAIDGLHNDLAGVPRCIIAKAASKHAEY